MAKIISWNKFTPISITQLWDSVDYGNGPKQTEIIKVEIQIEADDGSRQRFMKMWDMRPGNPGELPGLPSQVRNAPRHQADKWLYEQTALEAIDETGELSFEITE